MSVEELRATVEGTVFRNGENGYTVLEVRAGREHTTAVGVLPELAPGEQIVLRGAWATHPQYGRQFKAAACDILKPSTALGVERYLGSGLIRGVGPATAKLIVARFGKDALDILSEHPERLSEVSGIGQKRARQIAESFAEQFATRRAMVFLQTYGLSPALAVKISKVYGERTQPLVEENPYRLVTDIEGVGFLTADRIALSMGVAADSEHRVRAGLLYTLSEAASGGGHAYLPAGELTRAAAQLLRVEEPLVANALRALLLSGELTAADVEGAAAVYLPAFYKAEQEVARRLLALLTACQTHIAAHTQSRIARFEQANGIAFGDKQREAVTGAVENGLFVITGGPGTGKTTIINCILHLLREEGEVILCAPTGRAAKRMSEATGYEAKTLHRLLEYGGEEGAFQRDEDAPLEAACVIVDEMSMVDLFLMRSLLRALTPGTRLILVGDADQLPSVGAGNVLGDILQSGALPVARLTDIFRQGAGSMIVDNAHRINRGDMPVLNRRGSDFFFERVPTADAAAQAIVALCRTRLPAYLSAESRAIQVLSPTKKGACGVHALNRLLQAALNPPDERKEQLAFGETVFRLHDKVMHVKNNYQLPWQGRSGGEGTGVFNGDVGFITGIDTQERTLTVCYDEERAVTYELGQLEELELAYCLSVHKSQGSEFPCVVMPVVGGPPMLLTRNLFYTALTRARKLVVLVGREEAIAAMVNNNHIARRYTALAQRLREAPGRR